MTPQHAAANAALPTPPLTSDLDELKGLAQEILDGPDDALMGGVIEKFNYALRREVEFIDQDFDYWAGVVRQLDSEHFFDLTLEFVDGYIIKARLEDAGYVNAANNTSSLKDDDFELLLDLCRALVEF